MSRITFTSDQQMKVDELIGAAYTKAYAKARGHYTGKVEELEKENTRLKTELEGRKRKKLFGFIRR